MAYSARVLKVMIASPSDVSRERRLIPEVIQDWNAINAEDRRIVLIPVAWETHCSPELGDRPQSIINRQIAKNADVLVGVFWTRVGSSTGVAQSGTIEEIEEHVRSGKPALIYFSSEPVRPDSIDREQYEALKKFKEQLKQRGLIQEYDDLADFRLKLARQLSQTIIRHFSTSADLGPASTVSASESSGTTNPNSLVTRDAELADAKSRMLVDTRIVTRLSELARDLLLEAIQDPHGVVMRLVTMNEMDIQTNGRHFAEDGDARSAAQWNGVVEQLNELALIEDRKGKGEVYYVTDEGYRIADLLRNS